MFAKFLRKTRKDKGQTQAEAADSIGVHVVTWSNWERGLRPNMDQFFKIADWAGVTADELRGHFDAA